MFSSAFSSVLITAYAIAGSTLGIPSGISSTHSENLEGMAQMLRGDVRVIVMGDSFSTPNWSRVPTASLLAWPLHKVSAIGGGAPQNSQLIRALAECSPVESLSWVDDQRYTIMRSSQNQQYFALPVRSIREIFTDDSFSTVYSDRLFQFRFDDSVMQTGYSGEFSEGGDTLLFRLLYWSSPNPTTESLEEVHIKDLNTLTATINLCNQARSYWHLNENPNKQTRNCVPLQINATGLDFEAINDVDNMLRIRIAATEPLTGTNKYFHPAGGIYYHADEAGLRIPGFYYSYMADDGWTLEGFGNNSVPTSEMDKSFSEEQFTHWLDVTTLDRNQPVVFYWYFNVEWLHYADVKVAMENMIAQAELSSERVGISTRQHLLVMPHMVKFGSLGNSAEAHGWVQEARDAMRDIASEQPNVSFASIYDATDGMLFNGSDAGINWLENHGFTTFECGTSVYDLAHGDSQGDLLDAAELHPWGNYSSTFFAAVLGNIIRDAGCPADIVEDGTIDIKDLLQIIGEYGGSGEGDINNDEVVNIHDILLLVQSWGDCWPIQAPFVETSS